MSTTTFQVPSISCGHCKNTIEGALGGLAGVRAAEVSVEHRTVTVDYDDGAVELQAIQQAIVDQGYEVPA